MVQERDPEITLRESARARRGSERSGICKTGTPRVAGPRGIVTSDAGLLAAKLGGNEGERWLAGHQSKTVFCRRTGSTVAISLLFRFARFAEQSRPLETSSPGARVGAPRRSARA